MGPLGKAVFESLLDEVEYNPKRALVYLALGIPAACVWLFAPSASNLAPIPLIAGMGGAALILKSVFFLRKSSDGFGVSQPALSLTSGPQQAIQPVSRSASKGLPPTPILVAQVLQDFGAGNILVALILHFLDRAGHNTTSMEETLQLGNSAIDQLWASYPNLSLLIVGGSLYGLGWLARKLYSRQVRE